MEKILEWILDSKGKGTITYRIVLFGMIGYMAFSKDYVSKHSYEQDKAAQNEVNIKVAATLSQVNNTLTLMSSQDERLRDHEARIRFLENKR